MQVKRSRPAARIEFSEPLAGPTGAKLLAYQWQWKLDLVLDRNGEPAERRVSDWDLSIDSAATGRQIVHQFDVDGQIVSAESALKLLGYCAADSKPFKAAASAAKTLAKLLMQQAELEQRKGKWSSDWEMVLRQDLPEAITGEWQSEEWGRSRDWLMGDAISWQIENSLGCRSDDEIIRELIRDWRAHRMEERGWPYSLRSESRAASWFASQQADLQRRITRAQSKL